MYEWADPTFKHGWNNMKKVLNFLICQFRWYFIMFWSLCSHFTWSVTLDQLPSERFANFLSMSPKCRIEIVFFWNQYDLKKNKINLSYSRITTKLSLSTFEDFEWSEISSIVIIFQQRPFKIINRYHLAFMNRIIWFSSL